METSHIFLKESRAVPLPSDLVKEVQSKKTPSKSKGKAKPKSTANKKKNGKRIEKI